MPDAKAPATVKACLPVELMTAPFEPTRPATHGSAETRRYAGKKRLLSTVSIVTPGPATRGMIFLPVRTKCCRD